MGAHRTATTPWDGLQIWRVDANILNKQQQIVTTGWSSNFGEMGNELITPHHKNQLVTKCYIWPWTWMDSLEWPRQQKMDITGKWNVRSPYKTSSLKIEERQLAKCNSDIVAMLGGSHVTTAWHSLRLRTEKKASRYEG
jgi:hypothetical protein